MRIDVDVWDDEAMEALSLEQRAQVIAFRQKLLGEALQLLQSLCLQHGVMVFDSDSWNLDEVWDLEKRSKVIMRACRRLSRRESAYVQADLHRTPVEWAIHEAKENSAREFIRGALKAREDRIYGTVKH